MCRAVCSMRECGNASVGYGFCCAIWIQYTARKQRTTRDVKTRLRASSFPSTHTPDWDVLLNLPSFNRPRLAEIGCARLRALASNRNRPVAHEVAAIPMKNLHSQGSWKIHGYHFGNERTSPPKSPKTKPSHGMAYKYVINSPKLQETSQTNPLPNAPNPPHTYTYLFNLFFTLSPDLPLLHHHAERLHRQDPLRRIRHQHDHHGRRPRRHRDQPPLPRLLAMGHHQRRRAQR